MKGSSTSVVVQSLADTNTNSSLYNTLSIGASKDAGAFYNSITGGGGSSCSLSISSATATTTYTLGKGGLYYCSGSGSASLNIINS